MSRDYRTLADVFHELINTPLFPILFISELAKELAVGNFVLEYAVLSVASVLIWVLSDVLTLKVIKERVIGDS